MKERVLLPWALLVLIGCGGGTAERELTETAVDATSDPPPTSVATERAPPRGCPAHIGDPGPSCDTGGPGECVYPEGTCRCATGVWCGGAAPPPMPLLWRCETPRPPCPAPGTACSTPGAACTTGECSWMGGVVCANGTWTAQFPNPPP